MTQKQYRPEDIHVTVGGVEVSGMSGATIQIDTPGQTFRHAHPDWPHECCYAGWCRYRTRYEGDRSDGTNPVRCESPGGPCDYYTGKPSALPAADAISTEGDR